MGKVDDKKKYNITLEMAHKYSANHKTQLLKDSKCGCFNCRKIFNPKEIQEWIPDRYDETAICPYCGIDSVIGESSEYPITEDFLGEMEVYWFQNGTWL